MSRHYFVGVLIVSLLGMAGWTLAQQAGPAASPAGSGPFAVSAAGDVAVLVDSGSGRTWVLARSVNGDSVWLPVRRVDSEEESQDWRHHERRLRETRAREESEREMRRFEQERAEIELRQHRLRERLEAERNRP